jgi:hypothetical protein
MGKKLFVAVFALVVSAAGVSAQEPDYESLFAPEPTHEISLSYGLWPVTDFVDMFADMFDGLMNTNSHTGAASMSYIYKLNDLIGVGGALVFAGYSGDTTQPGLPMYKNFYAILPQAKFNWYRSRTVTLYSRAAAGVTIAALRGRYSAPENPEYNKAEAAFIWQLSPIGIEVGRTFAAYAEAGFGAMGSAMLGIRFKF